MEILSEIYQGGFYLLSRRFEKKQFPFIGVEEVLPPVDVDLNLLADQTVTSPEILSEELRKHDFQLTLAELQTEFAGQNGLLLLHALLIAVLRRREAPENATHLFLRLWREQGTRLAKDLTIRWKISAATTFADHGNSYEQRSLGMGLSILFDMIKLHDSERRLTGQSGRAPFRRNPEIRRFPLAFGMVPYSFQNGDLDRNMLARLWALSEKDEVIAPLARSMLFAVMTDQRSIFARAQRLKPKHGNESVLDLIPRDEGSK